MDDVWFKDPLDTRWFTFNWSLAAGETITSYTVSCDANMTQLSESVGVTSVSIQVSGGDGCLQSVVSCNIHTSVGNIYETEKPVYIQTRHS
jgi:hypothetical protein